MRDECFNSAHINLHIKPYIFVLASFFNFSQALLHQFKMMIMARVVMAMMIMMVIVS